MWALVQFNSTTAEGINKTNNTKYDKVSMKIIK